MSFKNAEQRFEFGSSLSMRATSKFHALKGQNIKKDKNKSKLFASARKFTENWVAFWDSYFKSKATFGPDSTLLAKFCKHRAKNTDIFFLFQTMFSEKTKIVNGWLLTS